MLDSKVKNANYVYLVHTLVMMGQSKTTFFFLSLDAAVLPPVEAVRLQLHEGHPQLEGVHRPVPEKKCRFNALLVYT